MRFGESTRVMRVTREAIKKMIQTEPHEYEFVHLSVDDIPRYGRKRLLELVEEGILVESRRQEESDEANTDGIAMENEQNGEEVENIKVYNYPQNQNQGKISKPLHPIQEEIKGVTFGKIGSQPVKKLVQSQIVIPSKAPAKKQESERKTSQKSKVNHQKQNTSRSSSTTHFKKPTASKMSYNNNAGLLKKPAKAKDRKKQTKPKYSAKPKEPDLDKIFKDIKIKEIPGISNKDFLELFKKI